MHAMTRLAVAALICSMGVNLALSGTIAMMMPLKQVSPYMIQATGPNGDRLVSVIPLDPSVSVENAIVRNEIEAFVRNAHEVIESPRFMQYRWGERGFIASRSSSDVYKAFQPEFLKAIENLKENPRVREVVIENVVHSKLDKLLWLVQFQTIDHRGIATDSRRVRRRWTARLEVHKIPWASDATEGQFLSNPLGMLVTSYSIIEEDPPPGASFRSEAP